MDYNGKLIEKIEYPDNIPSYIVNSISVDHNNCLCINCLDGNNYQYNDGEFSIYNTKKKIDYS